MKKYILPALLLLLGSAGLRAADFWEKKDYKQWRPKDVHKMLTKSPWAQNVSLDPMRMRRGGFENIEGGPTEDPSARRGDPDQSRSGGGGDAGFGGGGASSREPSGGSVGSGGGLGPAGGGPGGFSSPGLGGRRPAARRGPPPINVTVRWASALPVKQAIIRARYRNSFKKPEMMKPGTVYEIRLPVQPAANLFKAGHRIRVDVYSSSFPNFDINRNTGDPRDRRWRIANNTVHHDAGNPSHVLLPLMP